MLHLEKVIRQPTIMKLQDKAMSQMEEVLAKPENEISKTDFATLMRAGLVISNIHDILLRGMKPEDFK